VGTPDKSGIGRTIAVMDMGSGKEGEAILSFIQETDYKQIELLKIELEFVEESELTQSVSFRINFKQKKTFLIEERIKAIEGFVKQLNPSLYKQIICGEEINGTNI
jgi:hypothetical protein